MGKKIDKDLQSIIDEHMVGLAEIHIECWEDRYSRKTAEDIRYDLNVNYDCSLELEFFEDKLGRELTSQEEQIITSKFVDAVIDNYYE